MILHAPLCALVVNIFLIFSCTLNFIIAPVFRGEKPDGKEGGGVDLTGFTL
jgi:hypothetical protein